MIERPIPFRPHLVREILDERKTETRRVVKPQPPTEAAVRARTGTGYGFLPPNAGWTGAGPGVWHVAGPVGVVADLMGRTPHWRCPYGAQGDTLWVRETWAVGPRFDKTAPRDVDPGAFVWYAASHQGDLHITDLGARGRWRPSIHMPRWASRLSLTVLEVRVERIQEIDWRGVLAEGIHVPHAESLTWAMMDDATRNELARAAFRETWDAINAARGFGWDPNPWVWVIRFKLGEAA